MQEEKNRSQKGLGDPQKDFLWVIKILDGAEGKQNAAEKK
jgi:hypothetical protein